MSGARHRTCLVEGSIFFAVEERERRLGLNEAMFREVNERVEDINKAFGAITGQFDIFCECGETTCMERISVPMDVYERVRSNSTHFLLQVGHEDPTVERMIENHETFVIVEKEGVDVEQVAEETDPRKRD
jgi:hypothetical protein